MEWRVKLQTLRKVGKEGVIEPKWINLGIVDAEAEEDVWPFAKKEWGLVETDTYEITPVIPEKNAAHLYDAVKELLEEINLENGLCYNDPETAAIKWMRLAVELIERTPDGREEGIRRV